MNKPVLLLVDDDRAVLEALEAELAPAFGEIARIEAFDDGRAVLDALPLWTAEQRSIAVAIVGDSALPGELRAAASLEGAMAACDVVGGTAPRRVAAALADAKARLGL